MNQIVFSLYITKTTSLVTYIMKYLTLHFNKNFCFSSNVKLFMDNSVFSKTINVKS